MFEPEIDRRCLSCGASVRQVAAFCPQCGQSLEKREPASATVTQVQLPDDAATVDESQLDEQPNSETAPTIWAPALPEPAIVRQEDGNAEPSAATVAETRPLIRDEARHLLETQPLITNTALSNQTVADIPSPVVRLPGDAPPRDARDHAHHLGGRVDRIRKVSSVMIDQAAYDPSFRFLLVAAVLFIMFLVLMLLSKVLG